MLWRHLMSTVTVMFAVLLAGILQRVERPGSVNSIMTRWWHLMVLQYVAVSFQLPSVSTANINTLQYPKPYKQCAIPSIPAVVMSNVPFHQSNIMAAFVHSKCNLLSDVSSGLPTYKNYVIHFTTIMLAAYPDTGTGVNPTGQSNGSTSLPPSKRTWQESNRGP